MIVIGKCKEIYKDDSLPSIKELIQPKPIKDKEVVLRYLKNGKKGAVAAGKVVDIINQKVIPGEFCCYSDGKFVWRSDTIYYFEKYNIKLEEEFIKHILN